MVSTGPDDTLRMRRMVCICALCAAESTFSLDVAYILNYGFVLMIIILELMPPVIFANDDYIKPWLWSGRLNMKLWPFVCPWTSDEQLARAF